MCCDHSGPQQGGSPSSVTVGGWIHRLWTHRYAQRDSGLATFVLQNYQMDPSDSSLFLFCGKSRSQLKALLWEPNRMASFCWASSYPTADVGSPNRCGQVANYVRSMSLRPCRKICLFFKIFRHASFTLSENGPSKSLETIEITHFFTAESVLKIHWRKIGIF